MRRFVVIFGLLGVIISCLVFAKDLEIAKFNDGTVTILIHGIVSFHGEPYDQLNVVLQRGVPPQTYAQTVSGFSGHYVMRAEMDVNWHGLNFSVQGSTPEGLHFANTLHFDSSITEYHLDLRGWQVTYEAVIISGKAIDGENQPVDNAMVAVKERGSNEILAQGITIADGEYRLKLKYPEEIPYEQEYIVYYRKGSLAGWNKFTSNDRQIYHVDLYPILIEMNPSDR